METPLPLLLFPFCRLLKKRAQHTPTETLIGSRSRKEKKIKTKGRKEKEHQTRSLLSLALLRAPLLLRSKLPFDGELELTLTDIGPHPSYTADLLLQRSNFQVVGRMWEADEEEDGPRKEEEEERRTTRREKVDWTTMSGEVSTKRTSQVDAS